MKNKLFVFNILGFIMISIDSFAVSMIVNACNDSTKETCCDRAGNDCTKLNGSFYQNDSNNCLQHAGFQNMNNGYCRTVCSLTCHSANGDFVTNGDVIISPTLKKLTSVDKINFK